VPIQKWVAVRGFSMNCASEGAPIGEWKAVHVNQKRFGSESNLITGFIWFIWLVWSIWFVLLLDPEKPNNQTNKTNQTNQINQPASRVLFFGATERGHGGLDGTKIPLRHPGKTDLIQQCGALSAKRLV
jgi:hypothetical protein